MLDKIPNLFGIHWTLDKYKWGLATLWSRAFDTSVTHNSTSDNPTISSVRIFAPFADMFNHSLQTNEEHGYNSEAAALQSRTHSEFKSGDYVVINYGAFPNHKLLRLYGFAVSENPFRQCRSLSSNERACASLSRKTQNLGKVQRHCILTPYDRQSSRQSAFNVWKPVTCNMTKKRSLTRLLVTILSGLF
eukprot:TRINITY_DN23519_c0_g1_i1.p1 TRINITY_DN23519_c0_g1~~TRINITY_DN23519_c0_g1_i1.p1  ORF type:complete len:190 (+),score=0.47 TRINITY_DN23519_c0_g1_i1:502-1071(+)